MIRRLLTLALGATLLLGAGCGDDPDPSQQAIERGLIALRGVEQNGFTLGNAEAPATLTIYGTATDLRILTRLSDELPDLTARFVKPGRLKVQWRTTDTEGAGGAEEAGAVARLLLSAGLVSNDFWPTAVVLSARYTGAWDDTQALPLLREANVPSTATVLRRRSDPRIANAVARGNERAQAEGIGTSPGWVLTAPGSSVDISREVARTSLVDAVAQNLG